MFHLEAHHDLHKGISQQQPVVTTDDIVLQLEGTNAVCCPGTAMTTHDDIKNAFDCQDDDDACTDDDMYIVTVTKEEEPDSVYVCASHGSTATGTPDVYDDSKIVIDCLGSEQHQPPRYIVDEENDSDDMYIYPSHERNETNGSTNIGDV